MAKKKDKIRINFSGTNSHSVTGSCAHIHMDEYQLLLECGLYQSTSPKEDYKINSSKFPFKPKQIDFLFLCHAHIDHTGRVPALYAQGCNARIICPKGTKDLFKVLGYDSSFILSRDSEFLNKKYKMKTSPIYTDADVENALEHFEEYEYGEVVKLNEHISFRFVPSGHIISAAQLELWLKRDNHVKKILYTSDLGNSIPKYYTEPFKPVQKSNLAICESTYSDALRQVSKKDRIHDLRKIETVIRETCLEREGKVLFPTFSLDRIQNILTHLYNIFKDDKTFKVPILIDSPLATKLTKVYLDLLHGDERDLLIKVLAWKNVKTVDSYEDSVQWQKQRKPVIILAASGFMQAGRSRAWVKSILPDNKSQIIFIGFASEGSLAGKLKKAKTKTVSIDGKSYANRCGIITLHSFSSHIQHDEMLSYYSDLNCEKICLVHGEYKSKCNFGKELQEEISKKNKTSKVIVANKSTSLLL